MKAQFNQRIARTREEAGQSGLIVTIAKPNLIIDLTEDDTRCTPEVC